MPGPNFKVIELYEDPAHDDRAAFQRQYLALRDYLREARQAGDTTPRYFAWRRWIPKDMTDAHIDYVAYRMAEQAAERAIIERDNLRKKSRRGQAF